MNKRHLLHIAYFLNFFLAFFTYSVVYINSSVLEQSWGESGVGVIYALASLVAIGIVAFLPRILRRVGDVRTTMVVMALGIVSSVGLAVATHPIAIAALFILHIACVRALLIDMDVFLEATSNNDDAGVVRGTFLTIANTALIISPLLTGLLLRDTELYGRVYLFSAGILIPALFILFFSFRHFKDPIYRATPLLKTFRELKNYPDILRIVRVDFVLRFFYAWMVIYTPLYLHNYIGLEWSSIGVIFTIMLIPFALFELPLGTLADRVYGEKEILIAGLAIMSISTISLFFITSSAFVVWTVALFLTRVGASAVEIMSETYFFKQIGPDEADFIGLFRAIEPFAYVAASLAAAIVLFLVPMPYLFPILGLVIMSAIPIAARIHDTR